MEAPDVHLQDVPDQRKTFRAGEILERSASDFIAGVQASKRRDVGPELRPSYLDGARDEASGASFALARGGVEPPAMVSANERVAIHLTFAKERPLVRAVALIRPEPALCSHDDEVDAACRKRKGAVAAQIRDVTEAGPRGAGDCVPGSYVLDE